MNYQYLLKDELNDYINNKLNPLLLKLIDEIILN